MKSSMLLLLSATMALAWFTPNMRIDHDDKPEHGCGFAAITLGPGTWSGQPLYVAFEDDSGVFQHYRSDIMFQKSTDAGRTWLPADVLVHRGSPFATYPDITTDPDGNIYIVYQTSDSTAHGHYDCVRSSDGGSTWTTPVSIDGNPSGWVRIAADSAGNLFAAWTAGHVYSSVSTDKGITWSPRVRVDDDTVSDDCNQADVFVQPGTNHYLVAARSPYIYSDAEYYGSYLYRSTDMGRTFQSGVRLDTFHAVSTPHVVADVKHVICDYSGGRTTEARILYTQSDTWGGPHFVGWSYYNGAKLAISADGRVHTALMVYDSVSDIYLTYYTFSSDRGVSWSAPELVNDDSTADSDDPDIAADSAGHAYVVWQIGSGQVWFSTNNPAAAIAEQPMQQRTGAQPLATVVRSVLFLPEATSRKPQASSCLLDISGREVLDLKPGANDVSALAPGVYFVRQAPCVEREATRVTKVMVTR